VGDTALTGGKNHSKINCTQENPSYYHNIRLVQVLVGWSPNQVSKEELVCVPLRDLLVHLVP